LTVYGVRSSNGNLCITLINKEADRTRDAKVTIASGNSYAHGQVMFLTVPHGDITATAGVTLGGASIDDNGSWSGAWTSLTVPVDSGHYSVNVPAASAALIQLTK
jgi:hypothetical protein